MLVLTVFLVPAYVKAWTSAFTGVYHYISLARIARMSSVRRDPCEWERLTTTLPISASTTPTIHVAVVAGSTLAVCLGVCEYESARLLCCPCALNKPAFHDYSACLLRAV